LLLPGYHDDNYLALHGAVTEREASDPEAFVLLQSDDISSAAGGKVIFSVAPA
jgi:hypothetical protein